MKNNLNRCFRGLSLLHALGLVIVLAGCAATQDRVKEDEYSGYLPDYNILESVDTEEGTSLLWLDESVTGGKYTKIMLDPIVFYPPEQLQGLSSEQKSVIEGLTAQIDQALLGALDESTSVVTDAGPDVARLRPAITGLSQAKEGMKAYEILPIAAIISGAKLAAGKRDQVIILSMETKLEDSLTGKLVGANVRKGVADTGENNLPDPEDLLELYKAWAEEAGKKASALIK